MADAGHNIGTGLAALKARAEQFAADAARWAKAEITKETAPLVRDHIKVGVDLAKDIEAQRRAEKKPHEDQAKAVDATFRPIGEGVDKAGATLKSALATFIKAEEERARREAAEARQRAEEEARKAAEAAKAAEEDDPFANFDAVEAADAAEEQRKAADDAERAAAKRVSIGSAEGIAKSTGLRSYYYVEIDDPAALVAHFAKSPDVIAAAEKAANAIARTTKGAVDIPGCRVIEDRRVA